MIILGIETSCDETAVAIVSIIANKLEILSNLINSQIDIHQKYGGIVPEVAAREHMRNIVPMIELATEQASLDFAKIDLLACTQGPGLATSLMVGLETAKTLAWTHNIKFIPVNHLAGHNWSWLLPSELKRQVKISLNSPSSGEKEKGVRFPFISLVVSGGHTELFLIKDFDKIETLGRTLDDAVGEAFDKVAKMLELGYPGGPEISKASLQGNPDAFDLPRPMLSSNNFNFSFAGLKTAVLYELKKQKLNNQVVNNMSASFQKAAVEVLVKKTKHAAQKHGVKDIVVSGGVSANKYLRQEFSKVRNFNIKLPDLKYTGDNAAMIALAGYIKFQNSGLKYKNDYLNLKALPNMRII